MEFYESLLPGADSSLARMLPVWGWSQERPVNQTTVIGLGESTVADPRHPDYCADSAAAFAFANGRGGGIIVADGIGKGEQFSVAPAQYAVAYAKDFFSRLTTVPTIEEGKRHLVQVLMHSAVVIKNWQDAYMRDSSYAKNTKQIDAMGAAVSIGITCIDKSGDTVLVAANRGDCKIQVIDVDKMKRNLRRYGVARRSLSSSVRTVTSPDAEGNSLTRSLRPLWISRMYNTGEGITITKLPQHVILGAMSDGWDKIVKENEREVALMQYLALSHKEEGNIDMQAFADSFPLEAEALWLQDQQRFFQLAPRDDISFAGIELITQRQQSILPFGFVRRLAA